MNNAPDWFGCGKVITQESWDAFLTARQAYYQKEPMTEDEKLKHCAGCRNDYYNYGNASTTGRCWSLPKMKVILRKEVSINQVPPWNQKARRFPDCYHKPQYVYLEPDVTC